MYAANAIQASFINILNESDDDSTTTQANNLQIRHRVYRLCKMMQTIAS